MNLQELKDRGVLIDSQDEEVLVQFPWTICSGRVIRQPVINGVQETISLSRFLLNCPQDCVVDHINGDKLDNRRSNLRVASHSQNSCNQKTRSDSSTGIKGVSFHPRYKDRPWCVNIKKDGKRHYSYHKTMREAVIAYNEKAKELHGEFAKLNPVPEL